MNHLLKYTHLSYGWLPQVSFGCKILITKLENKKVLLRERKRHTARRVPSACCAALSNGRGPYPDMRGVPHPVMVGDTPSSHGGGVPNPVMVEGYPSVPPSRSGVWYPSHPPRPGTEYPPQTWDRVPTCYAALSNGVPHPVMMVGDTPSSHGGGIPSCHGGG